MSEQTEWVSLKEAAKILGAHPATIRNWADQGNLPSQRTPGGHRRFRRADLEGWSSSQGRTPTHQQQDTEAMVVIQNAMGRARLEIGEGHLAQLSWYRDLKPDAKQALSGIGRQLMEALKRYLTVPNVAPTEAVEIGTSYGGLLREHGLTLGEAIRGFFTFNDFLFDSMLQLAELNHSDNNESIRHAYTFTREMLLALVAVYED